MNSPTYPQNIVILFAEEIERSIGPTHGSIYGVILARSWHRLVSEVERIVEVNAEFEEVMLNSVEGDVVLGVDDTKVSFSFKG